MTSFMPRTLSLTNRLQLVTTHTGARRSLAQPLTRIRSPPKAIIASFKSTSTKPPRGAPASEAFEEPRSLPTSGFETIQADRLIEEEQLPDYRAGRYYPVQLGEVFHHRYQAVAKLGFGSCSTTWLARDLRNKQYVALKVYVHTSLVHRELPFYHHIARHMTGGGARQGQDNIRKLLDSFEIVGPDGKHIVLVMDAAQMSLYDMKLVFRPDGFEEDFVTAAITELLKALDSLHTSGETVHTDIHPGNMLLGLYDNDNIHLEALEKKEITSPVPRKPVSSTRTIYLSRLKVPEEGPMLLSDFGEARIGPGPHAGDVMPLEYRAPEVLLHVKWSYPIDIWSVGLTAWDLLEPKRLFTAGADNGDLYAATHLSQLIAALGPPPAELLARNLERKADFWTEEGEWLGHTPIPSSRSLESLETRLQDKSKSSFLRFIRRALAWIPEERPTAKELLQDPWLRGTIEA
ncbi:hypothetical protein FQN54_003583 [Arachnomyces sp. PD_36]|nr:hypothetical protein FQN54_003583 [Arachnomyces sp. PD_36]